MAEDINKVIEWASSQGWTVKESADGYKRFYSPEGEYIVQYPKTPKNKERRLADVITALKRNGLEWPIPSKKELRSRRRKEEQ